MVSLEEHESTSVAFGKSLLYIIRQIPSFFLEDMCREDKHVQRKRDIQSFLIHSSSAQRGSHSSQPAHSSSS